tara:strand:+ start:19217 stop:19528 length:312 start_codon:yes stop_codon:yes gene_type:complete
MSGNDYDRIKTIIEDIIGDTLQGKALVKAIRGYFKEKQEVRIVVSDFKAKASTIRPHTMKLGADISQHSIKADEAMEKYTKKLALESEKLRKRGNKVTCTTSS